MPSDTPDDKAADKSDAKKHLEEALKRVQGAQHKGHNEVSAKDKTNAKTPPSKGRPFRHQGR